MPNFLIHRVRYSTTEMWNDEWDRFKSEVGGMRLVSPLRDRNAPNLDGYGQCCVLNADCRSLAQEHEINVNF